MESTAPAISSMMGNNGSIETLGSDNRRGNPTSILNVASNFWAPHLHTLVVTLIGRVVGGRLRAGDDFDAVAWVPLAGPFPDLACWYDAKVVELSQALQGHCLPIDPRFATR